MILLENKVLNESLNKKFIEAIEFRNIHVHNYVYLDSKQIYDKIDDLIKILTQIMNIILDYFKKNNIDP